MAYHESLWVTIAAAAPVLALTYVTYVGRADKLDRDAIDLGIWNDSRAAHLFLISGLGIVICTVDFVWGLISLATEADFGPVVLPLLLIVTAFLGLLVLTVLEMWARTWLGQMQRESALVDELSIYPEELVKNARIADNMHPYWPIEEAARAIHEVNATGHVVHRIDQREVNADGSFVELPVRRPRPLASSRPIDPSTQAALEALKSISSTEALIRIIWK